MLEHSHTVANCLEDAAGEELFASLIDILGKELAKYQELKDFLTTEKNAITKSGSLEQFNENNSLKENLILKSRILEEVRANILKKIARLFDVDERNIKLSVLAEFTDHEKRETLEKLKNALGRVVSDIARLNEENKYLLNTSLGSIRGSLNFISSLMNRSGVYLGNGAIGENKTSGRLLNAEG